MKLVLAEKSSVAQSIAKVLGATKREDGYLEGNGYIVSWCVGHLVELAEPEAYDAKYRKWTYADLPIFPMDWKYEVSSGTKKQFGILKKLMAREDVASLVCATDAGREGELIFRLVYHRAGCRKPFERLWISSMEDVAIKEGFENLRSGTEYDALYEAALCRERADWIVGINATRLFSTLYGQTLNVGRVMTPTLAMAVMREAAIAAFKPEPFYRYAETVATIECAGHVFKAKGRTILDSGWKAYETGNRDKSQHLPDLSEGQLLQPSKAEVKEGKTTPPKHYTEDTLLSSMETAGAKDMPEDAERKGLGTPATRASILEKLVSAGFAERKKLQKHTHLIPTQVGAALIEVLPEQLKSPQLTAEWEHGLSRIQKCELDPYQFMKGITFMVITLREGMSEVQTVCAAVHEIAHAKLHDYDNQPTVEVEEGVFEEPERKGRRTEEVEAESVAYSVCQYFHIETAENSFGYIAGWSQGKELKELRESLETINKTASELITDMEHNIGEICKERGIDLTPEVEGLLSDQDLESLYLVNDSIYLHVQKVDTGWDYTLYDKETMRLIDGGLMEDEVIAESPISRPIAAARTEIMAFEGIQPEKVIFQDIALLEKLRAAQDVFLAEAIQNHTAEVLERHMDLLPDPTISVEHMHFCGFTDPDMLPISEDRAKELAERGVTVYQLFDHGMKHRIDDPVDITVFGGLYGVTKQEWAQVRLDVPARDVERRFMERPEPVMAIYQLKETAPYEFLFEAYDRLDNPPARENYDCLYVREVHPTMPIPELLEQQFQIYNTGRPDDFTGHSLSMSDIIAIKRDGEVSYHYVDTFGFREVPNFQRPENYLKAAEMAMEDDLGMIDGIINNGRSASTQTEKKPSVVEQLKSQSSSPKKTVPSKKHKEEVR